MEVNFYNKNLYFNGYQNSKYLNKYTTNSLLNGSTEAHTPPDSLDLNDDAAIYKYSRQEIRDLYKKWFDSVQGSESLKKKYCRKQIDTLIGKLREGRVDSSHLEMILDLVKDKKLTPQILFPIYERGEISKRVSDDLDKLYGAYAEGKSAKDVFVPKFVDRQAAEKSIKTGDVCQIEGEKNISTKLPDGTIEELFITQETYLELFPPVERFITIQSHNVGDCYMLAALDNIQQNPYARHKLLEMFRENADGTVDIVFGGFENREGNIVPKYSERLVLHNISNRTNKKVNMDIASYTCEGFRAMELLNERERNKLLSMNAKNQYRAFCTLKNLIQNGQRIFESVKNSDEYKSFERDNKITLDEMQKKAEEMNGIFANQQIYTEEELDYFCRYIEEDREDELFCKAFGFEKKFTLTKEEIMQKLSQLKDKNDDISRYKTLVLERHLEYLDRCNKDAMNRNFEVLPKDIYLDIFNLKKSDIAYNHAGLPTEIFEKIGYKTCDDNMTSLNSKKTKDLLMSDNARNYVFCVSSNHQDTNNAFPIYIPHAYSLEPVDIEGTRKFIVRNPHNSMNEAVMTYGELCRHFEFIYAAKIGD